MSVGDIYQSGLHFTFQKNANIFCNYFRLKTEVDIEEITTEINVHVEADWNDNMRPIMDGNFVVDCIEVRQVWPNNAIPDIKAVVNPAGTRSDTDNLPGQCSLVATLFGDVDNPTNHNRGRDFWTGGAEGDQTDGKWIGGPAVFRTLLLAYYQARVQEFTGLSGNVFQWVVFSLTTAKLSQTPFHWVVQRIRLRDLVRTQRRRQPSDPCETFVSVEPAAS